MISFLWIHRRGFRKGLLSACLMVTLAFVLISRVSPAIGNDTPDTEEMAVAMQIGSSAATTQIFSEADEVIFVTEEKTEVSMSEYHGQIENKVRFEFEDAFQNETEVQEETVESEEAPVMSRLDLFTTPVARTINPSHEKRVEAEALAETYVGKLDYVWGGESLKKGCDCSGFIYAIYTACGYGDLVGERGACRHMISLADKGVYQYIDSLEDADLGDVIIYRNSAEYMAAHPDESEWGHCAFYAGNGMVVHCKDEKSGCVKTALQYRTTTADFVIVRVLP